MGVFLLLQCLDIPLVICDVLCLFVTAPCVCLVLLSVRISTRVQYSASSGCLSRCGFPFPPRRPSLPTSGALVDSFRKFLGSGHALLIEDSSNRMPLHCTHCCPCAAAFFHCQQHSQCPKHQHHEVWSSSSLSLNLASSNARRTPVHTLPLAFSTVHPPSAAMQSPGNRCHCNPVIMAIGITNHREPIPSIREQHGQSIWVRFSRNRIMR